VLETDGLKNGVARLYKPALYLSKYVVFLFLKLKICPTHRLICRLIMSTSSSFTSLEQFKDAYDTLFETFESGKTKSLKWRKWQLKQFWWMIVENEDAILKALHADLNRHTSETYAADILGLRKDILENIEHLEEWAADRSLNAGFIFGTLGGA
jgi:aldehyde dehydrogenase (NAD+)